MSLLSPFLGALSNYRTVAQHKMGSPYIVIEFHKGLSMDPIKRPTTVAIETALSAYYGEADERLYPET
jgi:hypothetical protein